MQTEIRQLKDLVSVGPAMLEDFDTKWASAGFGLVAAFDRAVLPGQPHS